MRKDIYDGAGDAFRELDAKLGDATIDRNESFKIPDGFERNFAIASVAAMKLYALPVEALVKLEKDGAIHPSTLSGDSLTSTGLSIESYFLDKNPKFNRDHVEQLMRTCYSAGALEERGM